MQDDAKDALFVDAYNLIYRAFHGGPRALSTKDGLPTGGILTLAKMLQKLPNQFNNLAYSLAVFDGGGNFRKDLDSEYKANRKPMPDELKLQFPYMKRAFELLGWPMLQAQNVEADDVIASLAMRAASKGLNTYIVSGDKDFRAIVTDNLYVLDTMYDVCYNPEKVFEKMGVTPANVVAFLCLLGDGSDNVQGVDKVGEKTAAKWLSEYQNLEGLIAKQNELKGVAGENFRKAVQNGVLIKNLELINMKTDLDITVTVKDVKMKPVDIEGWNSFCEELELKSLMKKNFKPS